MPELKLDTVINQGSVTWADLQKANMREIAFGYFLGRADESDVYWVLVEKGEAASSDWITYVMSKWGEHVADPTVTATTLHSKFAAKLARYWGEWVMSLQ